VKSIPRCIWTSPEVASVGLTEKEARKLHESIEISTFPFSANGKSRIINDTNGFVKVIAETGYGEIVGVHILGAHATELIAELSLAIQMEASFQEINETIHPHPTLSEAILEASLGLEGGMFHI
jgi:dihydrolipoamide dehydrogenase